MDAPILSIFSPYLCLYISINQPINRSINQSINMYEFSHGVLTLVTAKAVVDAGKKLSTRTPRTAACRCDGWQYRLLVLRFLSQSLMEDNFMVVADVGLVPEKKHKKNLKNQKSKKKPPPDERLFLWRCPRGKNTYHASKILGLFSVFALRKGILSTTSYHVEISTQCAALHASDSQMLSMPSYNHHSSSRGPLRSGRNVRLAVLHSLDTSIAQASQKEPIACSSG